MSKTHLTTGSEQPPKVEGKLRLYSMEFCPYAQRARLVLKAKNIPHDIVNINLINKPEWYLKIHPEGKVPALDTGKEVIVESLDIADYLDENYPNRPLYPSDPDAKAKDKELIKQIGPLTTVFARCVFSIEEQPLDKWKEKFVTHLQVFEDELSKRGTPYFGGDQPAMVDFMLWPWAERAGTVAIRLGQRLPFGQDELPLIRRWRKLMEEQPECKEMYHGPEKFWKIVEMRVKGLPPNYDDYL